MSEQSGAIVVEQRADGVAVVELNRPHVLNALDVPAKAELADAWRRLADDERVRAIVLAGAGPRAFCAGSDLKEMGRTGRTASTDLLLDAVPGVGVALHKPVIAAVHGHCVGMGVTIAVHTDLRVASRDARFSLPEVAHGTLSALTATRLPAMLGPARAAELMLDGRTLTAGEALDWGLVNRVVEHDPRGAAVAWAAKLAALPQVAVRETVRLLHSAGRAAALGARDLIADSRSAAERSSDFTDSTTAFREGR